MCGSQKAFEAPHEGILSSHLPALAGVSMSPRRHVILVFSDFVSQGASMHGFV